ncbi:hypothetical protein [Levilactobacillus yonginensis]|uniref:hypothetical protein n=1 Tax=Levilactobacillus yonginensis TaxID=1054041 RepID=UPI000F7A2037|nr:hypothetical protein [Levilactobacillus yonginensis]
MNKTMKLQSDAGGYNLEAAPSPFDHTAIKLGAAHQKNVMACKQSEQALYDYLPEAGWTEFRNQHLLYEDIRDLTYFRLNFFAGPVQKLIDVLGTGYQLEVWDRKSHRKHSFSKDRLRDARFVQAEEGDLVETLFYPLVGYRIRRSFTIVDTRIYWKKTQFFVNGKRVLVDEGLMQLQKQINQVKDWPQGPNFRIADLT